MATGRNVDELARLFGSIGHKDNADISLVLTRLLDGMGLDEDNRQRRMDMQKLKQLLMTTECESTNDILPLLSGSAYETTTVDGLSSDVDLMQVNSIIRVIDNIQHWIPNTTTYMIDNTGCYPSFVKLYLMSFYCPVPENSKALDALMLQEHVVDADGKIFYCHESFKKLLPSHFTVATEIHGPALTIKGKQDKDFVYTLTCKYFPKEAQQWKHRQTPDSRARIGSTIVDQATYCYLVGVGNKGSPTVNIEWRYSFSHIENQLVHAWNNVQYKCYVMAKFIHKDLVKLELPDCRLCSYHYKTTMMWMVEKFPTDFFTESNFGECVLALLKKITMHVRRKSLPHYFLQGCNLLYKLDEKSSKEISDVTEKIVCDWPYCLWRISRRDLGIAIIRSLVPNVTFDRLCKISFDVQKNFFLPDLSGDTISAFAYYCSLKDHMSMREYTEVFERLHSLVERSNKTELYFTESKQSVTFIVNSISCSVGLELIKRSDKMTEEAALPYKRLGLDCIQKYINDCSFGTGLQIAEYFTRVGNHQRALLLLESIESRIKNHTACYCRHDGCDNDVSSSHEEALSSNKPSLKEFSKYYFAEAVTYTKDDLPSVPRSLVFEMFRTTKASPLVSPHSKMYEWYDHAVIHCSVYLYYIRFLCFNALDHAHRQAPLDNMARASKQLETLRLSHLETNHNVLGDCYMTLGQLQRAYKEYRKSLLKQQYHNAAIWHLALLVRRKVCSD